MWNMRKNNMNLFSTIDTKVKRNHRYRARKYSLNSILSSYRRLFFKDPVTENWQARCIFVCRSFIIHHSPIRLPWKRFFLPNRISPRNRCMPIRDFHVNEMTVATDWFACKQNLAIDIAFIRELIQSWNCVLFPRDNLRDNDFNQSWINRKRKEFTISHMNFQTFAIKIDYFTLEKAEKRKEKNEIAEYI